MQACRRVSEAKPGTPSVRLRRETSCQACQANPWTQTAHCWSRTRRPNPPPPLRSWSRAETLRFPITSASTSQRNCHAWSDLTAPSTSSTSNSTMSATGANARTVSTSRSPREVAGPWSAARPARTASTPHSSRRSANSRAGCVAARTAARCTTATRRRCRWPRPRRWIRCPRRLPTTCSQTAWA